MGNQVVYSDGELELKISVNSDTIWLNQTQMSELFDTSIDNIGLHIKNIYKDKELDENPTTENFSVVRQEGNRKVKIIDEQEVYHFGASLKDLGKKWFAFSKFDVGALEMLGRLS